ncbi:LacI family DNA-binding transcriptional regulator [Coraliomargarita sp. SDUM461003]|uniref:LacI family DNA-binding transcriptional regulator n=1 Tax=Thalassobacterium maritimum TaxID=3041265 RepID=A0ABU1AV36_9BACT|nr:LacI family DNA-binding transcriptional regulator [Coraliomargarita sp. SDUM461003]MDQ8208002.1 LacI family DNA-binding transcriptional regulator [Coraliomargarita sp. SDUM461003]
MASIKDVAREAGVSTATVSRMMANKGYISEEARAKVEAAVKKLGYRPNRAAQQLRNPGSHIIALIVSDIQNPFFGELCRAVETFAQKRGFCVFVCNTDENPEKERRYLELVGQEQVAGVIISPSSQGLAPIQKLQQQGIPSVMVDRQVSSGFDAVLGDNIRGAHILTRRVLKSGYRRIAGIFGKNSFTADERLAGFEAALEENDQQALSIQRVPAFEAEGRKAMERLLITNEKPDAIICSSALIATGAYRAIHAAKLSIPEAIGFACFDDPTWATFVKPELTVIQQPASMIGETAAELLMKRIADKTRPPSLIRLEGSLIERGSLR